MVIDEVKQAEEEPKVGDVVEFISGSDPMTVTGFLDGLVLCITGITISPNWFVLVCSTPRLSGRFDEKFYSR